MSCSYSNVKAHEICEVTSSKRIYASEYVKEGVPFYRGREIIEKQKGLQNVSTEIYISESEYLEIKNKFGVPGEGDLLLTSVGTLGIPYIVKPGERFYFKDGNLIWFRKLRGIISEYLYYWLLSPLGKAELKKCTIGASQQAFTIVLIKNMDLQLPPVTVQKKVSAVLSSFDYLIKNNLRRIKILEEMAQALYREWFVHFRFPGHEGVRFVDSPLGKIPEGWEASTVKELFEIKGGGTPSKAVPEYWDGGTINWYVPSDLTACSTLFMEGSGSEITDMGLRKSSAQIFPPFSVMMTSRATLGVISINTTEACTNQGFITCIPNNCFPLYTLYHWLKENVDMFIGLGTGATFKEITKGVFKNIPIVVPQNDLVVEFEEIANSLGLKILNLQRRISILRCARDLLLPKLISGEVDVSEIDIA